MTNSRRKSFDIVCRRYKPHPGECHGILLSFSRRVCLTSRIHILDWDKNTERFYERTINEHLKSSFGTVRRKGQPSVFPLRTCFHSIHTFKTGRVHILSERPSCLVSKIYVWPVVFVLTLRTGWFYRGCSWTKTTVLCRNWVMAPWGVVLFGSVYTCYYRHHEEDWNYDDKKNEKRQRGNW